MRKTVLFFLALLLSISRVGADDKPAPAFSVQVELIPEKAAILLGEPTYLKFRVKNPTNTDWEVGVGGDYRNSTGRPDSFKLSAVDAQGKQAPQIGGGWNMGGLFTTKTVPAHGHYDYSLFLPHWFKITEPGTVTITAKRTLSLSVGKSPDRFLNDTQFPVEASASLDVLPADEKKLGDMIAQWGEAMLQGGNENRYEGAAQRLKPIDDPRIIPYFVRALAMKRFTGIDVLGRYADDAAFNALKKAMLTTGADITNTTTKELANSSADGVRHSVAHALSRSPHPEALDFLITQRHDPYYGVRLTVVHRLSGLNEKHAVPLLKEMTLDTNSMVSGEAKRYLQEFEKKRLAPQ